MRCTGGDKGFLVVNPEDDLIALALELDELLRLLQLEALLGQTQHQQVPKAMQFVESLLNIGRREMPGLDHLQPLLIQSHDRILVRHHLEKDGRGIGRSL